MSAARTRARLGGALLRAITCAGLVAGPAWSADLAPAAVTYVERPEDGPMSQSGRPLTTAGQARYGVDINSSIDLQIDPVKLQGALLGQDTTGAGERAKQLQKRVDNLSQAVGVVKGAATRLQDLLKNWKAGDAESNQKVEASGAERGAILKALVDTRRERLKSSGSDPRADNSKLNALVGATSGSGYDWPLVSELLNEEIAFARRDLDLAAAQFAFSLQIQPHLVPRTGQPSPVRLGGYNQAALGTATRYEKLQFSSAEQDQAYQRYDQLAKEISETQDVGEAIVKQFEAELQALRPQLDALVQAAEQARDKLRDRLSSLERWGAAEQRSAWLAKVEKDLGTTDQGKKVQADWKALDTTLGELKDDVAALRGYADLRGQLAGKTAPQAMNVLLGLAKTLGKPQQGVRLFDVAVWKERQSKIDTFVKGVSALPAPLKARLEAPDGPVADLRAAGDAFKGLATAVSQGASPVIDLLSRLLGSGAAQAAANLELPPGTKPVPVTRSSQLNSRIDLQRIPAKRDIGDNVEVRYDLFKGDVLVGGWTDEFALRSYGWNSEVLASLAFTKPDNGSVAWKATAAMSWLLSYDSWPQGTESGLATSRLKWFSGGGFSVMPLSSANDEGVKLGLAATVGFLNNRLLVGYGTNLQATTDKRFMFFSIRLIDFPALSGPLGGGIATPK